MRPGLTLSVLASLFALGTRWLAPQDPSAHVVRSLRSGVERVQPRRTTAPAVGRSGGCPVPPVGPQSTAPVVPGRAKTVALTFDDGPGASTLEILEILEDFGVRATFFNIGVNEAALPGDVEAEVAGGYLVGDHTWNHPDMTNLSAAAQAAELDRVIDEQRALTGTTPCVFRPPYGDYDATTLALARSRDLAVWMWDVDTEDWEAEGSASPYWVDRITRLAETEGGVLDHPVVIMHNQSIALPATVAALPGIIRYFEQRGYRFVDLLGRTGHPMSCGPEPGHQAGTAVEPGTRLRPGATVESPGGQYVLRMQRDGNLVETTSTGRPLWQSHTADNPGAIAELQSDGNLVVTATTGRILWQSGSGGHPEAALDVLTDGTMTVEDPSGQLWCSAASQAQLLGGEELRPGWSLESPTWSSRLVMQDDGNLVLDSIDGRPLWASGTRGDTGAVAVMLADGDLVVRLASGRIVWSAGTGGNPGARLVVTASGNALVESADAQVLWSSSGVVS